jgi:hypothetical protein
MCDVPAKWASSRRLSPCRVRSCRRALKWCRVTLISPRGVHARSSHASICSALEPDRKVCSVAKQALSVNQIFAYRLRDARLSKPWKQRDLADAMARIGHPIGRATIAKIEAGARGVGGEIHGSEPIKTGQGQTPPRAVSLEEAIAFAAALDVPPPSLFLPIVRDDDVQLSPAIRVDVDTAHAWARGEQALREDSASFYRFQTFARKTGTLADLEQLGIRIVHEDPGGPLRGFLPKGDNS